MDRPTPPTPYPTADWERINDFQLHRDPYQLNPTRLVSTANNIFRALSLLLRLLKENEVPPSRILLAFIEVTLVDRGLVHCARDLLTQTDSERDLFASEFIFDWQIPLRLVRHQISAQTLLDRGLLSRIQWAEMEDPSPAELRKTAKKFYRKLAQRQPLEWYAVGQGAYHHALLFGFGAPTEHLARELVAHDLLGIRSRSYECYDGFEETHWIREGMDDSMVATLTDDALLDMISTIDDLDFSLAEQLHDLRNSRDEYVHSTADLDIDPSYEGAVTKAQEMHRVRIAGLSEAFELKFFNR